MKSLVEFFRKAPTMMDGFILSIFTILVTGQPYFMHGEINFGEVGLYLPGINAILHGGVPFRDFFHLRGPFELYMPAFLMKLFGAHIGVMYFYFYGGTVLTLVLCVLIAKELYRTRYFLYLMVPVLVARTFPRVMYTFWGGMRYALGLLAILCAIKFFKQEKYRWAFLAGIFSCAGFFVSTEIGFCSLVGILAAFIFSGVFGLQGRRTIVRGVLFYALGIALVFVPFVISLVVNDALVFYLESIHTVVTNMQETYNGHLVSVYPRLPSEAFLAMINPSSENFRHMTPTYFYILLFFVFVYRIRRKAITLADASVAGLAVYGIIMYNTSFRSIWAAQFEMALQPEKILYFLILEQACFFLLGKKRSFQAAEESLARARPAVARAMPFLISAFFVIVFLISVSYPLQRFNKRFTAFDFVKSRILKIQEARLVPWANQDCQPLTIERAKGVIVPVAQARELETVIPLIQRLTSPNEAILAYPELAGYYFLADRPFWGRFPMVSHSWMNDKWHQELMRDLEAAPPRIAVVAKDFIEHWKKVNFGIERNRIKYSDVMTFIRSNYEKIQETPDSDIYQLKRQPVGPSR